MAPSTCSERGSVKNDPSVRRLVVSFGLFSVLLSVVDKLFGTGYILRMNEQGLGPAEIAFILALGSVVLAVVDFPAGNLADQWGRKRTAAAGAALVGSGLLMYGFATDSPGFIVAMTLWAAGMALITGAPTAWLVDRLESAGAGDRRTTVLSRAATLSMIVGALAALLVGAPLLSHGAHFVLFTAAALAFVTALVLLMGTDNRDPQGRLAKLHATVWTNARLVVRDPTMRLVLYKSALIHIGFTSFLLSYQLFATQELGLPESSIGVVLAGSIAAMALGTWLAGLLNRRWGLAALSVAGVLTCVAGYLMMSLAPHWSLWAVGLVCYEIGLGLDLMAFSSWLHDLVPAEKRTSWTSARSSIQTLAGVVGTLGSGGLISVFGFREVWLAATAITALALLPLLALRRRVAVSAQLEESLS
ncbi:MFS transporter [Nonomuraea fuscirosea]|uniref:MFS transporter n=1 Tax=Nonomuraea fuscirosea TaxID=1291556 RepID=UPI00341E267A